MKRIASLLLVVPVLAACGSPSPPAPTVTPLPEPTKPVICKQSTIDALSALHSNLELPDHLMGADAQKQAEDFDANETFSVLTHLSMEPGYTLDYVYFYEFAGGEPLLYARPLDVYPYLTYSEFYTATGITINSPQRNDYLEHVRVDGTAEGFFELALFHLMGDQFYLFWHANYNDATALCDQTGMEEIISGLEDSDFGLPIPAEDAVQARALDLEPTVEFGQDTVSVTFVFFTMWGGFRQQTYVFAREFPHTLVRSNQTELVPYDCGIAF